MTESDNNLAQAFATESVNASKNAMRALKAEKDGYGIEAKLFRALASGQQVHANKALMMLQGRIEDTNTNLVAARQAIELAIKIYRDTIMTAATERAAAIESAFIHFMKTATNHKAILDRVDKSNGDYHVCQICGFIAEGEVPERCPVCRAVPEQFEDID